MCQVEIDIVCVPALRCGWTHDHSKYGFKKDNDFQWEYRVRKKPITFKIPDTPAAQ